MLVDGDLPRADARVSGNPASGDVGFWSTDGHDAQGLRRSAECLEQGDAPWSSISRDASGMITPRRLAAAALDRNLAHLTNGLRRISRRPTTVFTVCSPGQAPTPTRRLDRRGS